jgi:hypothetical protein
VLAGVRAMALRGGKSQAPSIASQARSSETERDTERQQGRSRASPWRAAEGKEQKAEPKSERERDNGQRLLRNSQERRSREVSSRWRNDRTDVRPGR